jgi:hypothetical protein
MLSFRCWRFVGFLLVLGLAATPSVGQGRTRSLPFSTEICPIPAGVVGYPVWVRAADGSRLDAAFGRALAEAVARRWEPPSRGRGEYAGLSGLRRRVQPPEPRWPQDWLPSTGDTARVAVTLFRAAPPGPVQILSASGSRAFDRSVAAHFRDPAPASPELPPLRAGADSVRVQIGFGVDPAPDAAGVVRFAAQQAPAQLVRGSLRFNPGMLPSGSRVQSETTVKYDIDASGRIAAESIEILSGADRGFANALAEGLAAAAGTPAVSNCRPVASSVVQKFRGR